MMRLKTKRQKIVALILGVLLAPVLLGAIWMWTLPELQRPLSADFPLEGDTGVDGEGVDRKFGFKELFFGWFRGVEPVKRNTRILLLGFDSTRSRLPGRTDAIMVVEVRPRDGKVGVISIPRDLWVHVPVPRDDGKPLDMLETVTDTDIPMETDSAATVADQGFGEWGRINKAYRLGNARLGRGKGHTVIKEVLEQELGLEVDYTVAVDFAGFASVIDMLGGVEVNVECPMRDNFIKLTSDTGYEAFHVDAGRQALTGEEALYFIRSRHGRTDLDRARRQQLVMMGIRDKLLGDKFLELPALFSRMEEFVNMDMEMDKALSLMMGIRHIGAADIHGLVVGGSLVNRARTVEGKSVLTLNRKKYEQQRKKLYRQPLPGVRPGKRQCPDVDIALGWRERRAEQRKTLED